MENNTNLRWALSDNDLESIFQRKYCRDGQPNWGPALRRQYQYYTPDDYYEALLVKTIQPGMNWLDVGCGRDIFPSSPGLAKELCARCDNVVGVDPDPNVLENEFITAAFHGMIEDFETELDFDIVTMRMVAEHIADPDSVLDKIQSILKVGGVLIIVTPSKWAPLSIAATVVPFSLHHPVKKVLWRTEEQDTFPTEYKMNTRKDLLQLAGKHALEEAFFTQLDDCRVFGRFKLLNRLELLSRKAFNRLGMVHPENCILGIYGKRGT